MSSLAGASPAYALCSPGVGERLGNIVHRQLGSVIYPVLASVNTLGQGELDLCL